MSIDRLLTTVLQLYQDVHDDAKTNQILGTTTTLLTNLSNPLNVTLLTSQLLAAPAIWARGDGMRVCYRIISIFNTAALHLHRREREADNSKIRPPVTGLRPDAWASAVIKGADDLSSRWKHVLVLSGMLMGFEADHKRTLSPAMRGTLENAVVMAANMALEEGGPGAPTSPPGPVMMALKYAFPTLSVSARQTLNCDAILAAATTAIFDADGLQDGLFLNAIDVDMRQAGQRFLWAEKSPSFLLLRQLEQKPLVMGLGPLSKLVGFAIENARDTNSVLRAQDDILHFTDKLLQQWQATKFSEIEMSEEDVYLTAETLQSTWAGLWQLFKKIMYGVVAMLHPIVARSLLDPRMRNDATASMVASKTLTALRNLYFISSRNGSDAFQVYSFTYLASLDTLSRYADASAAFLQTIRPVSPGAIPPHPLHRTLDLFYLNVAEHLPLHLSPQTCDALIVQPAIAYLTHSAPLSPRMLELFEAAHSAILSTLSCPHNAPIAVDLVPFYAETLFSSFPTYISPRQFRVAFKTLMQILSPPFPIAASHPHLAENLLEMVRYRAGFASKVPLPPSASEVPSETGPELVSEQSTLVLTLIDALPYLHLGIFEEWLTLAALAVGNVGDVAMRETTKRRFWDVLSSGEMDVERAAIGVAWWGTKGGREAVLFGDRALVQNDRVMMSGALPAPEEGGHESKL